MNFHLRFKIPTLRFDFLYINEGQVNRLASHLRLSCRSDDPSFFYVYSTWRIYSLKDT